MAWKTLISVVLFLSMVALLSSCKKTSDQEVSSDPAVMAPKPPAPPHGGTATSVPETATEEPAAVADADGLVALQFELPKPMFIGTPQDFRVDKLEKPRKTPRPAFYAPPGVVLASGEKEVYSTDEEPIIGEIEMITDGDKAGLDGSYVELGPMLQHVTIDLEEPYEVYAILVWHFHMTPRVYHDVIVQTADDVDFIGNVQTLFNNDHDNSAGQGVGSDLHYVETAEGKLIDAKGVRTQYVRLYSNGNTQNELNHYVEVEIFGKPVE